MSEVVSIRLPRGTLARLKLLACRRSLELQREVRWSAIVKAAIDKVLEEDKKETSVASQGQPPGKGRVAQLPGPRLSCGQELLDDQQTLEAMHTLTIR
jgi:hypothetical protein